MKKNKALLRCWAVSKFLLFVITEEKNPRRRERERERKRARIAVRVGLVIFRKVKKDFVFSLSLSLCILLAVDGERNRELVIGSGLTCNYVHSVTLDPPA